MSVWLLFIWFQAAPNDHVKTLHLLGVYDSMAGCERHEDFYLRHLVANAELTCVQRYIDK